jgi:hypothetical protein
VAGFEFAARRHIKPIIEQFRRGRVNDSLAHLRRCQARYPTCPLQVVGRAAAHAMQRSGFSSPGR